MAQELNPVPLHMTSQHLLGTVINLDKLLSVDNLAFEPADYISYSLDDTISLSTV